MAVTVLVLALGLGLPAPAAAAPGAEFQATAQVQDSAAPTPVPQAVSPEVGQALWISEGLMVLRDSIEGVLVTQDVVAGPQRQVLRSRVRGWLAEAEDLQQSLVDLIPELPALAVGTATVSPVPPIPGEPAAAEELPTAEAEALELVRARLIEYTQWMRVAYDDQRERQTAVLDSLNSARTEAPPDRVAAIDSERRVRRGRVDTLFMGELELLNNSEAMGIDVADGWRALEQAAITRADGLTGRLQLARLDEESLRQELRDAERAGVTEAEVARLRNEAQTLDRLIEDMASTLDATSDFLDARGYETAAYRQLVIQATGEVTGDILDWDVLSGLVRNVFTNTVTWIRANGPTALVRLFIVLASIFLVRFGLRLVWWLFRAVRLVRLPRLASQLIARTLGPIGTLLGLGLGLWAIGADATTMLAGAGVAGVVLGFALQDSLANFASGFLILLYRPFDQDEVIEAAGIVGTVRSMGLANTTLMTFDNRKISIPNSKLWGTVIANRSSEATRRAETVLRVGFDQDVGVASRIVLDRLKDHELVLEDPAPSVYVSGAVDSWMELTVWAWTRNQDWWTVTAAMPALLMAALDEEGIPVPLPTQQLIGPTAGAGELA